MSHQEEPRASFTVALTEALDRTSRSREEALERAIQLVDPKSAVELRELAAGAAILGREDDAVEFLARAVAAVLLKELGEELAVVFVRHYREATAALVGDHRELADALRAVSSRYDNPPECDAPPRGEVAADPVLWAKFLMWRSAQSSDGAAGDGGTDEQATPNPVP